MTRLPLVVAGLMLLAGHVPFAVRAAAPAKASDAVPKHLGTWKLVSAKYGGQDSPLAAAPVTTLRHVTPTHYMWETHDRAGQVFRAGGGPYTLDGTTMDSTPEFGAGPDFEIIRGKKQTFTVKIVGDTWTQTGTLSNGTALEETWERLTK